MEKLRIAVVGYGNIGKYTVQALQAAPDMEIAGIVRRNGAADKPAELADYKVVKDITEFLVLIIVLSFECWVLSEE